MTTLLDAKQRAAAALVLGLGVALLVGLAPYATGLIAVPVLYVVLLHRLHFDNLPSGASRDYGKPFAETFAAYKGDFYQIDPMLFSPGVVQVTALASGKSFRRGKLDPAILARSFASDG